MRLANDTILDEREVILAGDLIDRLSEAVNRRVSELESEFRLV